MANAPYINFETFYGGQFTFINSVDNTKLPYILDCLTMPVMCHFEEFQMSGMRTKGELKTLL